MSRANVIILTAGGSGGHLTPLMSVAEELRERLPTTKLIYIGQTGDGLGDIMQNNPLFDAVYTVRAGKFRRYHGAGLKQLLDVKTMALNGRDFVYVCIGFFQATRLLGHLNPKIVFSRGGFVSVPVCLAAATQRIPYITHDSDAHPSLANRIIARWAKIHAVSLPKENYNYPQDKTVNTGVPLQKHFKRVTEAGMAVARNTLGLPLDAKVLLVIGGGLGAQRVNNAVAEGSKQLFKLVPKLHILHVAGRAGEESTSDIYKKVLSQEVMTEKVKMYGFSSEVARLSAASDVVITRAGATNMAEFAVQGKACIVVPNPQLTGGHQLKNAAVYLKKDAVRVVAEQNLASLPAVAAQLLGDKAAQEVLGENLHSFANSGAAASIANLLITLIEK